MGTLSDATKRAEVLNRELEKTQRLMRLPGQGATGPRRATAGDVRGVGAKIDRIGRKVDRLSGAKGDPFMSDLFRVTGSKGAL